MHAANPGLLRDEWAADCEGDNYDGRYFFEGVANAVYFSLPLWLLIAITWLALK